MFNVSLYISIEFSTKFINLVKKLKENKENIISNQIGRSGASIGANINEAQYGNSKADFISKLHIALKETSETKYWLILLNKSNSINDDEYKVLESDCEKIKAMLIKSLKQQRRMMM